MLALQISIILALWLLLGYCLTIKALREELLGPLSHNRDGWRACWCREYLWAEDEHYLHGSRYSALNPARIPSKEKVFWCIAFPIYPLFMIVITKTIAKAYKQGASKELVIGVAPLPISAVEELKVCGCDKCTGGTQHE